MTAFTTLHRVDDDGYLMVRLASTNSDGATTGTITSVSDTASSTTILAANTSRKGATVHTVQIAAGGYYELPATEGGVYTGKIVGIWASDASGAARITEFT